MTAREDVGALNSGQLVCGLDWGRCKRLYRAFILQESKRAMKEGKDRGPDGTRSGSPVVQGAGDCRMAVVRPGGSSSSSVSSVQVGCESARRSPARCPSGLRVWARLSNSANKRRSAIANTRGMHDASS